MKYPQSVPMPRDVEDWLEGELETLGIHAVVSTRYILNLLQQDSIDNLGWPLLPSTNNVWSSDKANTTGEVDYWQNWDDYAVKRLAVIRCLMAASDQKCEIESLVDELCAKLKEIQCGAINNGDGFFQQSTTPLYPAKCYPDWEATATEGKVPIGTASSVLTRGILRASLDQINSALPYDNNIINTEDCFSIMYCGSQALFGQIGGLLSEKAPKKDEVKRLYERAADRSFDKLISKFDSNVQDIWKNNGTSCDVNSNQDYFYNYYNLFSPTLVASLGVCGKETEAPTTWSLGGTGTRVVGNNVPAADIKATCPEPTVPASVTEEDLLTSARTHFRPIRCERVSSVPPTFVDGTTFVISNELEEIPFQRSESGTLFLETGKYMEYKVEDSKEEVSDFVPKFRVRQSNEKCCQTEENIGQVTDQIAPSVSTESSISDPDEFYFPGDDALALDINAPLEDEVELIVSKKWQPIGETVVENSKNLEEEKPSCTDPVWEFNEKALVENIVNEDYSWATISEANSDVNMDCNFPCTKDDSTGVWPTFSDWSVKSSSESCDILSGDESNHDTQPAIGQRKDWREIWGLPSLRACNNSGDTSADDGWTAALEKMDKIPKILREGFCPESQKDLSPFPFASKEQDSNQEIDWSSFGPLTDDKNPANDTTNGEDSNWPKLGAALSAYLEESRARAYQLLDGWRPITTPDEANLVEQESYWRNLWAQTGDTAITLDDEWRDIWRPMKGCRSRFINSIQADNYHQLRNELVADGDQLLSDIRYLQLSPSEAGEDFVPGDVFNGTKPGLFQLSFVTVNNEMVNERSYNRERAQKERKRRNSSSQKICDQYMEGECRRPHCRFLHCDAAIPCPFFADASCLKGDACPLSHSIRTFRESQRAFTL